MNEISTPVSITINCPACYQRAQPEDAFCSGCSYPFQAAEEEQKLFIARRQNGELDLEVANSGIRRASNSLKWIAGLLAVSGLIEIWSSPEEDRTFLLIFYMIAVSVYIFLAIWSSRKPMAAIVTGLVLFVLMHVLAAIGDPKTIIQGLIFKIFMVVYLVRGLKAVLDAERIRKEHNFD
jgi:hypothetical protein